jgi:hypothetical protein
MVIGVLYLLCREVAEVLCKELEVVLDWCHHTFGV